MAWHRFQPVTFVTRMRTSHRVGYHCPACDEFHVELPPLEARGRCQPFDAPCQLAQVIPLRRKEGSA